MDADERLDLTELEVGSRDIDRIFVAWDEDANEYLDRREIERGLCRLWDRSKDCLVRVQGPFGSHPPQRPPILSTTSKIAASAGSRPLK